MSGYWYCDNSIGFSIDMLNRIGYQVWITKWVPEIAFYLPCLILPCIKLCLSLRKMGMHKGICFPNDVTLHLYPGCLGPVSKQNILEADVTAKMQTGFSLEYILFDKSDKVFGVDFSTLNSSWGSLTANLPPRLGNLSAVIVILFFRIQSYITLVRSKSLFFPVPPPSPPPFLVSTSRLLCCQFKNELLSFLFACEMTLKLTSIPSIPK